MNMLAREYCTATKRKFKPVILSHAMLPGLLQARRAWRDPAAGQGSGKLALAVHVATLGFQHAELLVWAEMRGPDWPS